MDEEAMVHALGLHMQSIMKADIQQKQQQLLRMLLKKKSKGP